MSRLTGLNKREGTWRIRRRVPKRYKHIDGRTFVNLSLHTDSMDVARQKAPKVWQDMIEAWEAKLAGDTRDAEKMFEAARELAAKRGFRFLHAREVAQMPRAELEARLAAYERAGVAPAEPDPIEAAAVLGGAQPPKITMSRALEIYWEVAEKSKTRGKSADQIRRWRNPRVKAFRNFIEVVGDKALEDLAPDDMLDFMAWWEDRLETEGLTPNSANKDLTHLGSTLREVIKKKRLPLNPPLTGYALPEGEKGKRLPWSDDWIRAKLLAPGALAGLNAEARAIMLIMLNTGARPSEIQALTAARIVLDAEIPHISIEGEARTLKSPRARRKIPLTGVSLEAAKLHPEGFPRYHDNPSLSATVNKFLRENGLAESPKHTLYGFRHSFEDRCLAAGIDERVRRDLMGHALTREEYGAGATLEHLHRLLAPIAI
ncbi:DUF6538 domain-containing protein [Cereibacter sphaeroides f. sp. denitrificans]|nr:integrase [Cereibacter sphaeroides f. sp. denitrificans]